MNVFGNVRTVWIPMLMEKNILILWTDWNVHLRPALSVTATRTEQRTAAAGTYVAAKHLYIVRRT